MLLNWLTIWTSFDKTWNILEVAMGSVSLHAFSNYSMPCVHDNAFII